MDEIATPQAFTKIEAKKAQKNKKKEEEVKAFEELISTVGDTVVKIFAKANEKGHLFKAVSVRDVVEAIKQASGIEIDENTLVMEHIKELGTHTVIIKKGDKKGKCQIVVEAQ